MNRRSLLMLAAITGLMLVAPVASAGDSPEGFIKDRQAKLAGLLKAKASDSKIEAVFDEMLDYDTLGKESLGKHWDDRSAEERREFQTVLKRLVRNAYRKNLKKTLDYDVSYKGEGKARAGTLVRTVATSRANKREEPVAIDYLIHKVDGKWRVYDITTEGSSLTRNYRSQFNRVIKKKGFAELMRRMKSKLDKEDA
ncbi:MAG: ABC transporter substrate-binding protein [Polyangiaceae bacterium]